MTAPRITPGTRQDIGVPATVLVHVLGRLAGTSTPNVFSTLARNRRLFRRWMVFASGLMPGGKLPRQDTELVILRVADLCGSGYEWEHHSRLALRAGLTEADVARVRQGPADPGWTPRQRAFLRAADGLHHAKDLDDDTWAELRTFLDEELTIEFCLLVGHYEMLAMTLNSLRVEPDAPRRRRFRRRGA